MKIKFSPVRSDEKLSLFVENDSLQINGETFDFSPLSEGSFLPAEAVDTPYLVDKIFREEGEIWLTVILPHKANACSDVTFPPKDYLSVEGVFSNEH